MNRFIGVEVRQIVRVSDVLADNLTGFANDIALFSFPRPSHGLLSPICMPAPSVSVNVPV